MLRNLRMTDIENLILIENSVHIIPWNKQAFNICLQTEGNLGWVKETDKENLIGFIIIRLKAECHVLNLSIAKTYQRQGLGGQLLTHALQYAKQKGVHIAYLEVRRSNLPAINLYKKMAFTLIGERKNYYPIANHHEDALIFAKNIAHF